MKITNKPAGFGKEFKDGGFKQAFHSLPHKKLNEAREDICRICYWNITRFRSMLHGNLPFRIYEIEQIEKYFESQNLNAWTGENLI